MTVSYLDTLASLAIAANSGSGLAYGKITRGMRVHTRSLVADGYAASFASDDSGAALNDPEGIVWLTSQGADYVSTMVEAGLMTDPTLAPSKPKRQPKARKSTTPKPVVEAVVPTPTESVQATPATLPKPTKVTVVAPSKKGPQPTGEAFDPTPKAQVQPEAGSTVSVDDRIRGLEVLIEGLANRILQGSVA